MEIPAPTSDYCASLYLTLYADTNTLRMDQLSLQFYSDYIYQNCMGVDIYAHSYACLTAVSGVLGANTAIAVDYEYLNSDANQINWMGC